MATETRSTTTMNANSNDEEITQQDALRALLSDEKYADVTMKGSDGSKVRANRAMLAARSPVFDRMLYGEFKEAARDEVEVGYDGVTLKTVVSYIYTDMVPIIEVESVNVDAIRKVFFAMDAASYFGLLTLRNKTEKEIIEAMNRKPAAWLRCLAICDENEGIAPLRIKEMALEKIRTDPKILVDEHVNMLSEYRMEETLKDQCIFAAENTLFQALSAWSKIDCDGENTSEAKSRARKRKAAELTRHISLKNIDPFQLSSSVAPSGLVTKEQLFEAFKAQALYVKEKGVQLYEQVRGWNVWTTSKTDTCCFEDSGICTETLRCTPLSEGVHTWMLLVEEMGNNTEMELGVVSANHVLNRNIWLNESNFGWALDESGSAHHNHKYKDVDGLTSLEKGSTVKFTLDLTKDNGCLSVSIDERPNVQLFEGMLTAFDGVDGTPGFVPAIGADERGKVRFLGFE